MTATVKARGAVGAVVDGYMRDTKLVLDQDFPVFSMGRDAQGSGYRNKVLAYRVPVEIGGITIDPGDIVFGDIDGVVVIPKAIEQQALEITFAKVRDERATRQAVEQGMSAKEAVERFGVF